MGEHEIFNSVIMWNRWERYCLSGPLHLHPPPTAKPGGHLGQFMGWKSAKGLLTQGLWRPLSPINACRVILQEEDQSYSHSALETHSGSTGDTGSVPSVALCGIVLESVFLLVLCQGISTLKMPRACKITKGLNFNLLCAVQPWASLYPLWACLLPQKEVIIEALVQ